jgi:SAM-dependent methyltransferase
VAEAGAAAVLEVGCGDGAFAARLAASVRGETIAVDLTERAVELARRRGVTATQADVQELPFEDGRFDCVVAKWMLYHVPDLDRGIAELARVLRPGGRLVATTLSEDTSPDLWELLGDKPGSAVSFSRENGEEMLRRRFARVERRDIENVLVFPDPETLRRWVRVSMLRPHLVERVPEFEGELRVPTRSCMFVAEVAG